MGAYAGTPGYNYDASDNANRRARATYAWEYQRRRGDTPRTQRAQQSSSASSSSSSSSSYAASSFETLAQRQMRREQMASGRGRAARENAQSSREHEANVASSLVRFLQMGAMLFIVFKAGGMFVSASGQPTRFEDEHDWHVQGETETRTVATVD